VPFSDGIPIDASDLYELLGGSDEVERLDGPKPADDPSSSSGGKRNIKPIPETASNLRQLEELLASEWVWELAEELEQYHNSRRPAIRPGTKRGYKLIDILVVEAGTHLYANDYDTWRNLKDPKTWRRLRRSVKRAFRKNPERRLSKEAPSRGQIHRARRHYFSGVALAELHSNYRRTAVATARDMGLFDPGAGSWTHPNKSQSIVADMTWVPAATKHHRNDPPDPNTGKPHRLDPGADYHHYSNGKRTKVPGRELVMLSCRTRYANERIPLDFDFMSRKGSPDRLGRNEADKAVEMLDDLVNEHGDLLQHGSGQPGGVRAFVHDMAMDSEAIDTVLDMRILPVVKVPRTTGNKFRDGNIGPHEFTTSAGHTESHDIKTVNGSCWVLLPNSRNTDKAVPLSLSLYWGARTDKRSILYATVSMPNDPNVPTRLRGATSTIRFNSTETEIHSTPHTRRTRSLRPIPEASPDFEIFGIREDIESLFSDYKYRNRGRLCSVHDYRNRFNILAYMILRLSRTRSNYHKRTATTATHAVPIAA
jgi:hypothetical protein